MGKRNARINESRCVACGECAYVCPKGAVEIKKGIRAVVDAVICVGCGLCAKSCPADCIEIQEAEK